MHELRAKELALRALMARLAREQVPLTVCPLSNVALGVVDRLENHSLPVLLDAGVAVTLNSDDPAFFDGYVGDNYVAAQQTFRLTDADMVRIARTSLEATFLPAAERRDLVAELDAYVGSSGMDAPP